MLIIEARRGFYDGHEYTSASLYTKNHVLYGRIEVRYFLFRLLGLLPRFLNDTFHYKAIVKSLWRVKLNKYVTKIRVGALGVADR